MDRRLLGKVKQASKEVLGKDRRRGTIHLEEDLRTHLNHSINSNNNNRSKDSNNNNSNSSRSIQGVKANIDTSNISNKNRILIKGSKSITATQRLPKMGKSITSSQRAISKILKNTLRSNKKSSRSSSSSFQRTDGNMGVKASAIFIISKSRNINNKINSNRSKTTLILMSKGSRGLMNG
jgi:hypothetical protein